MSGERKDEAVGFSFYFDRVGEKWLMTVSEGLYFWNEAEEAEPHAQLIITTYRLSGDRNNYPPGAKAEDRTVLVPRIGHERAIPAHPVLAENDGSFRCRIRPGTYVVVYEEITGQLKDQRIKYTTTPQAFEAGRSYRLTGYSTTILDPQADRNRPEAHN